MSVHQTKDGRWFCQWYDRRLKLKRRYFGRGELARRQAEKHDATLKTEKELEKSEGTNGVTVAELCIRYHNEHPVAGTTGKNNYYKINASIIPILGKCRADLLGTRDLNEFVMARLNAGMKWGTVKRELALLKAAFNWAARQKPPLISRNVPRDFRVTGVQDKDVPMPPTTEEINRILVVAEPHLVRAIHLLWYTGIRPGEEMERLRWSDVDLTGGLLRVVSARKGGMAIRYIPVSDDLKTAMELWKAEDSKQAQSLAGYPVVHYHGKPVLSLKKAWAGAKTRAGIVRAIRLYDLRHKFATELLEQGIASGVVSKFLGHSREDTTQRHYLHVTRKSLQKAVNIMPRIDHYQSLIPGNDQDDNQAETLEEIRGPQPSQG